MRFCVFLFILLLLLTGSVQAQFAPQAGVPGSTAIHKSSALIRSWANYCSVQRGFLDIATPSSGYTSAGDSTQALGVADGAVVSLGDSGVALIKFAQPLYNGTGPDFAVFENGFQNPANAEQGFLELAFVEVSSDGEHFFRFPATSNTPSAVQIKGSGDYMDARLINNLAGKYVAQYGTPFDLEELKTVSGLDVEHVTHIRIVDVIGSISSHSSSDQNGQKINDPYNTPYPTGGFDLDAVAAINIKGTGLAQLLHEEIRLFPNPASFTLNILLPFVEEGTMLIVADISGKTIIRQSAATENVLDISQLHTGLYLVGVAYSHRTRWIGKCAKL